MSPFFRLMKLVSKRISSVLVFSSWIIILLVEVWIFSIVPDWVCFVWDRRIRRRIPRRERRKVILWSFIRQCNSVIV